MSEQVAILGCGPAGLLAAHAVAIMGHEPIIMANEKKASPIPGAVFLHEPIPGVTPPEPDGTLNFRREGSAQGYAAKVYGDPEAPTSWGAYEEGPRPAWSMFETYSRLWAEYAEAIVPTGMMGPADVESTDELFHLVISTIPAGFLCCDRSHMFPRATVHIADVAWRDCPEDTIIYNGDPTIHWYRTSCIFGHAGTESSAPMAGSRRGVKPLNTTCDCFPNVVRAGRFGEWRKGVLVHHAFSKAMEAVTERFGA